MSGAFLDPTARCPVCGAEVFFYANENGSRVYFDEVGPPWTKHPCTDNPTETSGIGPHVRSVAAASYPLAFTRRLVSAANFLLSGVFIVVGVQRRGPKRVVELSEVGGRVIRILTSPPPPVLYALAVSVSHELHWIHPETGARGTNPIWQRSDENPGAFD